MIRVGVLGAAGRMGRLVCAAVEDDPELELVVGIARPGAKLPPDLKHVPVAHGLDALREARAEVAVDFTVPAAVMGNVRWLVSHGVHAVVGTTGIGPDDLQEIGRLRERDRSQANVVVAPNFAIGAVLMQRFAEEAARFFPAAEIIELHHEGKADAPSGTSLATARRMSAARSRDWNGPTSESLAGARGGESGGIRIHSVRLPGLVAHQEVVFGGEGETLTIRHDSTARTSFMPGVILAIKAVPDRPGVTVGMEPLLGLGSE